MNNNKATIFWVKNVKFLIITQTGIINRIKKVLIGNLFKTNQLQTDKKQLLIANKIINLIWCMFDITIHTLTYICMYINMKLK